jgi:glycosyltransferase involved in cell wall biosynthesis
MTELPTISITTPSYNQGRYLEQTIRSVLDQPGVRVEYSVLDGGSTDDSVEIIRRYADQLSTWCSGPDQGQADAINRGWAQSTGEILAWLNSDDLYCPNALRSVAEAFAINPNLAAVVGECILIDEFGHQQGRAPAGRIELEYLLGRDDGTVWQPAVFIHRRVFETIGGLEIELNYLLDSEYWLRLALNFSPRQIMRLPFALAAARRWRGAKSSTGVSAIVEEQRNILDKLFAREELSTELNRYRTIAYARSYWWQAELERKAHQLWAARRHAWRAWQMAPDQYTLTRLFRFWIKTFVAGPIYQIQQLRLIQANRKNNVVQI